QAPSAQASLIFASPLVETETGIMVATAVRAITTPYLFNALADHIVTSWLNGSMYGSARKPSRILTTRALEWSFLRALSGGARPEPPDSLPGESPSSASNAGSGRRLRDPRRNTLASPTGRTPSRPRVVGRSTDQRTA